MTESQRLTICGVAKALEVTTLTTPHESTATSTDKSVMSTPCRCGQSCPPYSFNFRKGLMLSVTSSGKSARQIGKSPTSNDDQMLLTLGLTAANIEVVDIEAMNNNAVGNEIVVFEVTRTERQLKHYADRPPPTEDVQRKVNKKRKRKSKEKAPSEPLFLMDVENTSTLTCMPLGSVMVFCF